MQGRLLPVARLAADDGGYHACRKDDPPLVL